MKLKNDDPQEVNSMMTESVPQFVTLTIDGQPAESWVPTPGTHRVVVTRGDTSDAISIVYE